jgi:hypothetical protein
MSLTSSQGNALQIASSLNVVPNDTINGKNGLLAFPKAPIGHREQVH